MHTCKYTDNKQKQCNYISFITFEANNITTTKKKKRIYQTSRIKKIKLYNSSMKVRTRSVMILSEK